MGAWAVDALTMATIASSGVINAFTPTSTIALLALSAANEVVIICQYPEPPTDPFPPGGSPVPGGDEPPPGNICGPDDEDCPDPTTPPDEGGGGGSCDPASPEFEARHAQWAQKHPADTCPDCCL